MAIPRDAGLLHRNSLEKVAEIFRICGSIDAVPLQIWKVFEMPSKINDRVIDFCPIVLDHSLDSLDILLYSFSTSFEVSHRTSLIQSMHLSLVSILNAIKKCEVMRYFSTDKKTGNCC